MTAKKNKLSREARITVLAYMFMVGLLIYFTVGSLFLRHHDLGWHIATGDLIREKHSIPFTDPWSFTAHGYPWLNISWLWDVMASALFSVGGFGALIAMTIVTGACICVLLAAMCLRAGGGIVPTVVGVVWVAIALPLYEGPLDMVLGAAPQAASLLLFLICWYALERACRDGRGIWLLTLPPLMCLWANVHGGFLLLFLLLGAYIIEALSYRDFFWVQRLLMTLVFCCLAMLVNPYGIDVITGTLRTLSGGIKETITDFMPYTFGFDITSSAYLIMAILVIDWRSDQVSRVNKMLAAGFLLLGLLQQRNFCYFMFTSLPLAIVSLQQKCERLQALQDRVASDCGAPGTEKRTLILSIVLLAMLVPATMSRWPMSTTFPADIAPLPEIDYLVEHFPNQNIYNHWNFGGFMIFETRGKLRMMIDGRAGTAYPMDIVEPLLGFNHEQELIDRYDLKVALLPRYIPSALTYFETSPNWTLVFSGKVGNVYVRRDVLDPDNQRGNGS